MKDPVEWHKLEYEWEGSAIELFSISGGGELIVIQVDSFEEAERIGYEKIKKLMLTREEGKEKFRFQLHIISLGDLVPKTYIINTMVVWVPPKPPVPEIQRSISIPDDDYYY